MEIRSYLVPTALATLLHIIVLGGLLTHWIGDAEPERRTPRHIQARMIDLNALSQTPSSPESGAESETPPAPDPAPKPNETQQKQQEQQAQAEQKRREQQAEQARKAAEEKARQAKALAAKRAQEEAEKRKQAELAAQRKAQEEARRKAEQEAQRQAQAKREAQEKARRQAEAKAKAEAQRQEQARAEAQAKAKAEAARAAAEKRAQSVVGDMQSYIQTLVEQNWRIPRTARNGMEAVVAIRLLGNGEVDQATIVTSSGDAAFDRSAVQAVYRTERFERVAEVDPILFERRLRSIKVIFRPEGLRW
ncbi:MAG: protein TolA [Oceanospirillaceae bacterium]|uniref:cell envelope integrity protein TolA n=1 Tax=Marinobacterium litorale TaxID=404770 RepID=UPI00042974E6|nr:cell envelope integrity protein TolA [Marinobacterium litorale]MBS99811.1 protein TolA [Oceanospirillaceae bacterium]